jgi:hypothetical protein
LKKLLKKLKEDEKPACDTTAKKELEKVRRASSFPSFPPSFPSSLPPSLLFSLPACLACSYPPAALVYVLFGRWIANACDDGGGGEDKGFVLSFLFSLPPFERACLRLDAPNSSSLMLGVRFGKREGIRAGAR